MEINAKNSINNIQCLCLYCDKTFPNIREQENHVEREHKTILCKGKGSRKSERIIKNNSALENIPFPGCFHCNKKVLKADDLEILYEHLRTAHKDVYFGCKCKIRKLDKISLANHKKHCNVAGGSESARKSNLNGNSTCDNLSESEDIEKALPATAIHKKSDRTRLMKVHNRNASAKKNSSSNNEDKDENQEVEYEIPLTRQKLKSSTCAIVSQMRSTKKSHKATKLIDSKSSNITTATSPVKSQRIKPNKTVNNNSLTVEPVESATQKVEPANVEFDEDFYRNISQNIRGNLSLYVDGKRDRLKNLRVFDQLSETTKKATDKQFDSHEKEIHESTNFEASTPFPALLTAEQYGFGDNRKKLRRQITKNSWKWRWDLIKKYKYINEGGKIVKKVKQVSTGLKDLSQLDMWTQLSMRSRYENLNTLSSGFDAGLSESLSNRMIKTQNIEQLNTILDKRIALDIDSEQREQTVVKVEPENDDEVMNNEVISNECEVKEDPECSVLKSFGLQRTKTYERKEPLLSGEWARPRCYICFDCGQSFDLMKNLNEHKNSEHPYIVTTHYEVVGHENLNHKLYKKLFLPKKAIETSGFARSSSIYSDSKSNETNEASTSSDNSSKFSENQKEKECSKCLKTIKYSNENDIYRHVLDCIEDRVWMQAKRRNKYRKSRRKSRKTITKKSSRFSVDQKKSSSPSNKDNTEGESCQSLSNPPTPNTDLTSSTSSSIMDVKKMEEDLIIDVKKINDKPMPNGTLSIKNFFRVSKTPLPSSHQKLVVQMMEISDENSSIKNSLRPRNNSKNDEQPKKEVVEKVEKDLANENDTDSKNDLPQTSIFTPLSVCTPESKSLNEPQLISPSSNASLTSPTLSNSNVPKKKKKLNDCIAMLTCKIQEKMGVSFFDGPSKPIEAIEDDHEITTEPLQAVSSISSPNLLPVQCDTESVPAEPENPLKSPLLDESVSIVKPKAPSTSFQIASLLGDTLNEPVQEEVIDLSLKKSHAEEEVNDSELIDKIETSIPTVSCTDKAIPRSEENTTFLESEKSMEAEKQVLVVDDTKEKSLTDEEEKIEKQELESESVEISEKEAVENNDRKMIEILSESKSETNEDEPRENVPVITKKTRARKALRKTKAPPKKKALKQSMKITKNRRTVVVDDAVDKPTGVAEENVEHEETPLIEENVVQEKNEESEKIIQSEIESSIENPEESKVETAEISNEEKNITVEKVKIEERVLIQEDFKIRIPKRRIPNLKSILEKKNDSTPSTLVTVVKEESVKISQPAAVKTNNCNLKISEEERRAFEEQKNRIQQILNKSKQQSNAKKDDNKTPKRRIPPPKKNPTVRKKSKAESNTTPDAAVKTNEDMSIKLEQTIKTTNRVRCRRLSVVIDPIVNLSNFQTKNRKIRLTNNSQQNGFYDLLTVSDDLFTTSVIEESIKGLKNMEAVEKVKNEAVTVADLTAPADPVEEEPCVDVGEVKISRKIVKKCKGGKKKATAMKKALKVNEILRPATPEPTLVEDVLKPRAAKSQAIGLMSADKPQKKIKLADPSEAKTPKMLSKNLKSRKKKSTNEESSPSEVAPTVEDTLIQSETLVTPVEIPGNDSTSNGIDTDLAVTEIVVHSKIDPELKIDENLATPYIIEEPAVSFLEKVNLNIDDKIEEKSTSSNSHKNIKRKVKKVVKSSKKIERNFNEDDIDKSSMKENNSQKIEHDIEHDKKDKIEIVKANDTKVESFNPFTINEDSLFNDDDNDPSDKINDIVNNIINSSEFQNDSETEKSESNATSVDEKNQNLPVCIICRRTFRNEKVYEKHCKTSTHVMKVERRQRFLAKKTLQPKSPFDKASSPILDETKTFRTKGALKTFENIVELTSACDKQSTDIKRKESLNFLVQNDDDNKHFFDIEKIEKKPEDMTAKDKDQLFDSLFNSLEANALSEREKTNSQQIKPLSSHLPDSEIESSSTSWDLKNDADIEWTGRENDTENSPLSNAVSDRMPKKTSSKVNKSKETVVSIPTKSLIMGKIFKKHRDREKQNTPQADAPMNKPEFKNSLDEIFDHLKNTSEIDDRVLTCPSPKTLLLRAGGTFSPNSSNSNDMLEGASHSNNNNNIYKIKTPEKVKEKVVIDYVKKVPKSDSSSNKKEIVSTEGVGIKRMPRRRCAAKTKTLAETWSSDEYEELHDTEDIISIINEFERRESIRKNKQLKVTNSTEESSDQKLLNDEKKVDKKIQFVDEVPKANNSKASQKRVFDVSTKDGYKSEEEILTSSKEILPSKPLGSIKKRRMSCFVPSTKPTAFEVKSSIPSTNVLKMEKEVLEKFNKVNSVNDLDLKPKLSNNNYKKSESEMSFTKSKGKSKSQKQRKKSKNRIKNIAYDTDSDFELNISKKQKSKAQSECMSSEEDDNESVITAKTCKSISTQQHMTVIKESKLLPNDLKSIVHSTMSNDKAAIPDEDIDETAIKACNRTKRQHSTEKLYYWSSSSDSDADNVQQGDVANVNNEEPATPQQQPEQHGWIVGDSHKKLVTLLAHAKIKNKIN